MNIERIKDIREDRNITQSEIAKILSTTQSQYSLYETGIRLIPIDKLDILANYYNTSVDYLIGRTDKRESYPKTILK